MGEAPSFSFSFPSSPPWVTSPPFLLPALITRRVSQRRPCEPAGEMLQIREENADFALGTFERIAAMNKIFGEQNAEITTNRPR